MAVLSGLADSVEKKFRIPIDMERDVIVQIIDVKREHYKINFYVNSNVIDPSPYACEPYIHTLRRYFLQTQ